MTGRQDDQSASHYRTAIADEVGALIDHSGVGEIMLDLRYDIRGNGPTFKAMQQFLRGRQPPILAAAGVNDEIFPGAVQRLILTGRVLASGFRS
jgi:hypothetical protein